jgi:putative MATE family efflux protein
MEISQKSVLTEGPVVKSLMDLTLPMILGMLGMVVFNLADTYFVGKLGKDELAAMSFTFPVIMVIGSIAMGMGIGVAVLVSRAIGEGCQEKVQRLTTDSIILSLLIVLALIIVGMLTIDPVFKFLGATEDILPLIKEYLMIWYPGMIALVIPVVGNSIIRATGDTKTPSKVMLIAAISNIILDPLLIFGLGPIPRLELAGAAIATVCTRSITLFVCLWILFYKEQLLTFKIPSFNKMFISWKQILYIALPSAGSNLLTPAAYSLTTKLIAVYGPSAVAAFGIANRIEGFALMVLWALGASLTPFVGQNWGAKKFNRAELSIKYSQIFSLIWGGIIFIILALTGKLLASIFTDNPEIISTVGLYFLIVPLGYGLQGVLKYASIILSILNKPLHSSILRLCQTFALYIPMAYLGSELFGMKGIFAATSLSFIITGISAYFVLKNNLADSMDYDFMQRVITIEHIEDSPVSLGYWVGSLYRHTQNYIDIALSKYQLKVRTLPFFMTLLKNNGLTEVELAEKLNMSKTITKYAISSLIDLGYIRHEETKENNKKKTGLFTTRKAEDISEDVRNILLEWSNSLSTNLTEKEKETAIILLKKMNANAEVTAEKQALDIYNHDLW